ncbi:unnamed protein product [Brugia pahangi]|uniref:Uncharacterized protein n=1 Tax=Brugia pahangi TaxID=6280 RepID=A0A0N4TK88_BRUPA|nr:unnamed protein product [Brugia pahangi]
MLISLKLWSLVFIRFAQILARNLQITSSMKVPCLAFWWKFASLRE